MLKCDISSLCISAVGSAKGFGTKRKNKAINQYKTLLRKEKRHDKLEEVIKRFVHYTHHSVIYTFGLSYWPTHFNRSFGVLVSPPIVFILRSRRGPGAFTS